MLRGVSEVRRGFMDRGENSIWVLIMSRNCGLVEYWICGRVCAFCARSEIHVGFRFLCAIGDSREVSV